MSPASRSRFCALPVFLAVMALDAPAARAQSEQRPMSASAQKAPWRYSQLIYRNAVNLPSFDRGAELTYNPYYAMTLGFRGQWWFNQRLYLRVSFALTRELTESDLTTDSGEIWPSDTTLRAGAYRLYTIPRAKIALSASLDLIAPTSPASRARTMVLGLRPGVALQRSFSVLSGLLLRYSFSFNKLLHRTTTAEREVPLIPSCGLAEGGCSQYLNRGLRNPSWRLTHQALAYLQLRPWVALAASFAARTDYLHRATDDARVSSVPQESTDERYALSTDFSLTFIPWRALSVSLGLNTDSPLLAPDGNLRAPVFNRYTVFYLDLGLDLAELVAKLRGA